VLALDLPGRRDKPGDLLDAHIDDWVDSLVADIDEAGIGEFVLVGHSLGGLTVPVVVAKLGRARVREMVLAAAFVPPHGASVVDTLPGIIGWYARRKAHNLMVSEPTLLAELLLERCRSYA
jgi:pimeloyl-ACP methyl ester carboxylesterase